MYSETFFLVLCAAAAVGSIQKLPVLGTFDVKHPGFITLSKNSSKISEPTWNIIISSFNGFPFSTDYVSLVRDIGSPSTLAGGDVEKISDQLHWPNEPNAIPERVFNRRNMVIIPSGFLVPTKGQGALTVFDLNKEESMTTPYQLTSNNNGDWFYHRVVWLDMDGDGKDDIITCRAQKPIFGSEKGELLWLKQPDVAMSWNQMWQETILSESFADTFLIPVTIKDASSNKTVQTLITAGFFSESLDIWWRDDESKPWTMDNLKRRQVDSGEGNTFDLIHADLNGDGVAELLVTYNKPSNGTMIVYETTGDLRTSEVRKHLIISGLDPAKSGTGKGAPGGIKLAWPDLRSTEGRPDIILSGDDNGKLYLLRANDVMGWSYESTVLLDASPGTMGAIAVGDINGDFYPEIIAPSYDDNKVTILSYKQSTVSVTTEKIVHTKTWLNHLHDWVHSLFN